eukprot:m.136179 g.136179  ORF g.136179 m.136179 type:complete len:94 (+) comp13993_c0_seq2:115-396(+)
MHWTNLYMGGSDWTGASMILIIRAGMDGASNARDRDAISYKTHPNAQTSAFMLYDKPCNKDKSGNDSAAPHTTHPEAETKVTTAEKDLSRCQN